MGPFDRSLWVHLIGHCGSIWRATVRLLVPLACVGSIDHCGYILWVILGPFIGSFRVYFIRHCESVWRTTMVPFGGNMWVYMADPFCGSICLVTVSRFEGPM